MDSSLDVLLDDEDCSEELLELSDELSLLAEDDDESLDDCSLEDDESELSDELSLLAEDDDESELVEDEEDVDEEELFVGHAPTISPCFR